MHEYGPRESMNKLMPQSSGRPGLTKTRQVLKSVTCASGPYSLDFPMPSLGSIFNVQLGLFHRDFTGSGDKPIEGMGHLKLPWPPNPYFVGGSGSNLDHYLRVFIFKWFEAIFSLFG